MTIDCIGKFYSVKEAEIFSLVCTVVTDQGANRENNCDFSNAFKGYLHSIHSSLL